MKLSFFVHGIPVPQGSLRTFIHGGKVAVTSANKNLRSWRQDLAIMAQRAVLDAGWLDHAKRAPVGVTCTFQFPRPGSLPKRITQKVTKPDLDKLVRSVLDALTNTVLYDDAQVIRIEATKEFSDITGAFIQVETLDSPEKIPIESS